MAVFQGVFDAVKKIADPQQVQPQGGALPPSSFGPPGLQNLLAGKAMRPSSQVVRTPALPQQAAPQAAQATGANAGSLFRPDARNRNGYGFGSPPRAGAGALPVTPPNGGMRGGFGPRPVPAVPPPSPPQSPSPYSSMFPAEYTYPWGKATPQNSQLRSNLSSFLSDETKKTDISDLDDEDALAKIANIPVYKYKYKPEFRDQIGDHGEQRLGPMAQDWAREFGGPSNVIPMPQMIGALVGAVRALDKRTSQKG